MPQYLLQAGNTPALTLAEAQAVADDQAKLIDDLAVIFQAADDQQAQEIFKLLGAAVKLVRVDKVVTDLEADLTAQLLVDSPTDLQFAVGYWGEIESVPLMNLKKSLKSQGVKSRFMEAKKQGLSAAVLLHQSVTELIVIKNGEEILLGTTLAVQDIDHWTVKDRRKPYAARKKGMLPPKVARAMLNLALGKTVSPTTIVYDPFCGTGTILIEALERGVTAVGSDLDRQAVAGTKDNLAWFAEQIELKSAFEVFHSQVAQVEEKQLPGKVDAIVTEPFLGKPNPEPSQLPGIFKGLEKLYLGAFKHWQTLLKDGAKVVMVLPRVDTPQGQSFNFEGFVDKLSSRGYTLQVDLGKLNYHRETAIVQRDIGIFTYRK